jgi:peptidoglycan/LPS O-acetylase OafA/YrhL/glycosyltransferase involved in cell wall biosynthesis
MSAVDQSQVVTGADRRSRLRLDYLDGIRGLAALYVVLFHISQLCHGYATGVYHAAGDWTVGWSMFVYHLVRSTHFILLGYGRFAVDIFIVLSGYCLMLPVARAKMDTVPRGFWGFMNRRAWRILPPYYFAIALVMLLVWIIAPLRSNHGAYWDSSNPIFTWQTVLTHLFLIHSLGPWALRIDGPMWSVAVEWQIYILFPLLLLPMRRQLGSLATAILVSAMGVGLFLLLQRMLSDFAPAHVDAIASMSPWFVGQFALGMFAASIGFSGRLREMKWHDRWPWAMMAGTSALLIVAVEIAQRKSWETIGWLHYLREATWGSLWPTDLLAAVCMTCLIIHLTRKVIVGQRRGILLPLFESKPAMLLGAFSYSLYLVHFPIVNVLDLYFRTRMGPATTCVMVAVIGLPLCLGLSYLFYLAFERPFVRGRGDAAAVSVKSTGQTLEVNVDPTPSEPLVSVIMPSFNAARYLPRGVASVLGQTYRNVEVIVVDDASDEDPAPALAQFGDRVKLIRNSGNSGPSATRNNGIAQSHGQLLVFLDADDWWPAEFLQHIVGRIRPGLAVCYDNHKVAEASLTDEGPLRLGVPIAGEHRDPTLLTGWFRTGPDKVTCDNMHLIFTLPSLFKMVVHRVDSVRVQHFDERFRVLEDFHYCVKLLAAGVTLDVLREPLGFYLVRSSSILRTVRSESVRQIETLLSEWRLFDSLLTEHELAPAATVECARLRNYYRARYADAVIKSTLASGSYRELLNGTFIKTFAAAAPGIVRFKTKNAAGRVRGHIESLARPVVRLAPVSGVSNPQGGTVQ